MQVRPVLPVLDVGWQHGGVAGGGVAGLERFAVVPDAVAQLVPEALPVVAPAQLGDQLGGGGAGGTAGLQPGEHRVAHLGQGEHAVADVGRQARDGAIEGIAAAAIGPWIDRRQAPLGRGSTATDWAQATGGAEEQGPQRLYQGGPGGELAGQVAVCGGGGMGGARVQGGRAGLAPILAAMVWALP